MTLRSLIAVIAVAVLLGAGEPPDFETRVLPVLTKSGCNVGSCHGAAIGRGGFRLSLLGQDPEFDRESIVEDLEGRRVNLARPESSLILRKPTEQTPHEGGPRLSLNGPGYRIVLDWLKAGAPRGSGKSLRSLNVVPRQVVLASLGERARIQVRASFSDGEEIDVTRWSVMTPDDPAAIKVDPVSGEVTPLRLGKSTLIVRFLQGIEGVSVTVPFPVRDRSLARSRANFVDDEVNRGLDRLRLPNAPRCDDETFLRRVSLDLIGTLPTIAEQDSFLADRSAEKCSKLVDRLTARREFIDLQTYALADLFRVRSALVGPSGSAYYRWIREQVQKNVPFDMVARELILTVGDTSKVGAANFSRIAGDARGQAELVAQVFLGTRIQCANCHNHPLDRWTQDDYHGLAAVFAKLDRGQVVSLRPLGDVSHPKTGKPAVPRLPGGPFLEVSENEDARVNFATWLTSRDNPYFARNAVNRLWKRFMGRGLVEPVDDLRATNPASLPDLLDALARDFSAGGYDQLRTIKAIVVSEAYQRSSSMVAPEADDRFLARFSPRTPAPHVLVDAVSSVTEIPEFEQSRAIAIVEPVAGATSRILDLLGRCLTDASCSEGTAVSTSDSLPLALHAINGEWLNAKIAHPKGRLRRLLQSGASDREILVEFHRVALGKPPSESDLKRPLALLSGAIASERVEILEDYVWALLTSEAFTKIH